MSESKDKVKDSSTDLSEFVGLKVGMTRVFDKEGSHVPVTVVKLIPNLISQVKSMETDKYNAYQVSYYEKREKLINKPIKGHLKKASIDKFLARAFEIRMGDKEAVSGDALGKELTLGKFSADQFVDVTGISKGKGFQGVMKRYGFQGGPASHGSHFHRGPGAIGNRATPSRVFPQKKMPGQMGNVKRTVQNLKLVEINNDKGYMLIKGSIPGVKNSFVKVALSKKK